MPRLGWYSPAELTMTAPSFLQRFVESTRGQLVALLRRGARTVEELARGVGLTDNAVRAHLTALERDGIVRPSGVRRGPAAGKPATLYEIHPEAEPFFSRAYAPVLAALVATLGERLPAAETEAVMRDVGRRVAASLGTTPTGELQARVHAAAAILSALGGDTEVVEAAEGFTIRGCGCPLAAAVSRQPATCRAVEALLEQVIDAPVEQRCDHGPRPSCRFLIAHAARG